MIGSCWHAVTGRGSRADGLAGLSGCAAATVHPSTASIFGSFLPVCITFSASPVEFFRPFRQPTQTISNKFGRANNDFIFDEIKRWYGKIRIGYRDRNIKL
jgi:hypothetical protein